MESSLGERGSPTQRPLVVDIRTGTVGHVMASYLGEVYLRPVHGGPEWTLPADRVRSATAEEAEAAR
ncbi:hypothetical protein AB0I49_21565 [Streptomyces sp. NPDC050617]|uniref:Uncharacterized protein n=1 Tax=Streptomyces varsoviensis TaxID=67373 RepID=A0ABR5J429_9ACTN|nr:hypothetical protein [Streptomyces varsoviensis]KOG88202.1 hypothetical protein ADK38_21100 [Streptomyces varsoviensis]